MTQTQHVTDVGRMPHAMLTCGMQVLICDGHVVHKHGKGLWYGANMVVVRVMGLCAPKCTNLQPPPGVVTIWQHRAAHLSIIIRVVLPDPLPAVSHLRALPAPPN